jgi:hypothetical protein
MKKIGIGALVAYKLLQESDAGSDLGGGDVIVNVDGGDGTIETPPVIIEETPGQAAAEQALLSELVATVGTLAASVNELRLEMLRVQNEYAENILSVVRSEFAGIDAGIKQLIEAEKEEKEEKEDGGVNLGGDKPRKRWL